MLGELFDPEADFAKTEHFLPHWAQSGAIVFVTMRTLDSIPKEVLERWENEKREWFKKHGFPFVANWKDSLSRIPTKERQLFNRHFQRTREDYLDSGMGLCLLRKRDLAEIVAKSLMHFDGERYNMGDFIIMPNHVHLLGAFYDAKSMQKQFDSWLHWTARHINLARETKGSFWQEEPFDHLVRTEKQYEYLREYIANNPRKAKLPDGEYYYRRHDSLTNVADRSAIVSFQENENDRGAIGHNGPH